MYIFNEELAQIFMCDVISKLMTLRLLITIWRLLKRSSYNFINIYNYSSMLSLQINYIQILHTCWSVMKKYSSVAFLRCIDYNLLGGYTH